MNCDNCDNEIACEACRTTLCIANDECIPCNRGTYPFPGASTCQSKSKSITN